MAGVERGGGREKFGRARERESPNSLPLPFRTPATQAIDKLPLHRLSCQLFSSCFDLSPSSDTSLHKRDQERIIVVLFCLGSTLPLLVFKLNES